jgi:Fe-S-cluster-containing dehydrogenase component
MARYGLVVDITKCNGCYNCFIACKDEYCGNDHPPYSAAQPMTGHSWMRIVEKERGRYPKVKVAYTAVPCMHCEKPPCVDAGGGSGAVYKRSDGVVLIDPAKAAGREEIVAGCPYRVIYWNEESQTPQKCTFCAHLLDQGWKEPRCVEACPTRALVFGDTDDPASEISQLLEATETEVLRPEYGLGERVRYIGLPKRFVAGSVVLGDTDECAIGARVALEGPGATQTVSTDCFGDFEFEDLPADRAYSMRVSAPGYEAQTLAVKTNIDIYVGDIILVKKP